MDVPEASCSSGLSEDPPEELLRVDISLASPVVLLLAWPSLVLAKARGPVCVIPLPFHLITEHLDTKTSKRQGEVRNVRVTLFVLPSIATPLTLYLIGFCQLGKFLFCRWVIWVGVWVVLFGQLKGGEEI